MSTLTTVPKEADYSETTAETIAVKPAGSHRQPRSARWRKARSARDTALPPIAVLLARPVLLTICAVLGALVGFVISDGSGYRAAASIEFTVDGNDVALVEVEGKTLADRMTSAPVVKRAAAAIDESPEAIEASTTAEWQPGSTLVELAAVAPTPSQAWN